MHTLLKSPTFPLLFAFLLAFTAIAVALLSQYAGGLEPCSLCLQQRMPYYVGVPLLGIAYLTAIAKSNRSTAISLALVAVAFILFAYGIDLSTYHAGAEWGFWPGPQACSRTTEFSSDLNNFVAQLNETKPIDCTKPAIRVLGLSMAGWNTIVQVFVMLCMALTGKRLADAIVAQIKHRPE